MIALAFDLSMRSFNIEPAHDNRATASVAADSDFQDAVLPTANNIREALEVEVVDYYEEGFTLEYTDTEPRSEEEEAKVATMLYSGNIATLNEMRIKVGLDPVGFGGDRFSNGLTLEELQKAGKASPSGLTDVEIPNKASLVNLEEILTSLSKPEKVMINAASSTDRRQPLDLILGLKR
jgi:hypothetical protein